METIINPPSLQDIPDEQRVTACVIACSTISTPALEAGLLSDMIKIFPKLLIEFGDLLERHKRHVPFEEYRDVRDILDKARPMVIGLYTNGYSRYDDD